MKIETTFLKSKVARRIFMLFVFCALVPILALAITAFTQVRGELLKQSQRRLHEASRSLGASAYERIFFLVNDLRVLSLSRKGDENGLKGEPGKGLAGHLEKRFKSITLIRTSGDSTAILGEKEEMPELSSGQRGHLASGKPLLFTQPVDETHSRIFLLTLVEPLNPSRGILMGEILSSYLWDLQEDNTLPTMTELCVLDPSNNVIFSTHPVPTQFRRAGAFGEKRSFLSRLEWEYQGTEYLSGFWSVFLEVHFFMPRMTVVMSSPKEYVLSPISYFKRIFPPVILLSFLVVVLLSIFQIRRTTQPLEQLTEGTRRIAMRDFDSRVDVRSGDEFEDLGGSFNDMSRQLGRQFDALTTMAEIDRAILSSLDTRRIVDTVITRVQEFFAYELVSIALLDPMGKKTLRTYSGDGNSVVRETALAVDVTQDEVRRISAHPWLAYEADQGALPAYLQPYARQGYGRLRCSPSRFDRVLRDSFSLALHDPTPLTRRSYCTPANSRTRWPWHWQTPSCWKISTP